MDIKLIVKILISGFLLWNCASVKTPPGGPIDETPPEILNIDPPSGSVNLNQRKIEIEFSEYMDENSFKNNIVVFPRLEKSIKYKFKGDRINLTLPENLDTNKTYIIQLNRNIKDEHGVPLANSLQLAYSVGNNISKGRINGRVFGSGNQAVHLWKIDSEATDSIFATVPDYITDVDDDGNYTFEYLASGNYNILAVDRNGSDLPLNTKRTEYGMFWRDNVELSEDNTLSNINIRMWMEPQNLKLLRGEWSAYNWGTLFFNNDLPDSFSLSMQLIQNDNNVNYDYYIDETDHKNLIVSSNDSLFSKSLIVYIDSLISKGDTLLDSTEITIQIPQEADTSYLQIVNPQSGLSIIPDDINGDQIDLIFSKPVHLSLEAELMPVLLDNDSVIVDVLIEQKNPMYFVVNTNKSWEENVRYKFNIYRDGILTNFGRGLQDSIHTINITTKKSMGYGGIVGTLSNINDSSMRVELLSVKNPSLSRIADVNSKSQFEFKMIPEGDYLLSIFKDSNNDMKYNFGKAYQSQPSEWFYFYPDTFEVRANWDTEIFLIELPEED